MKPQFPKICENKLHSPSTSPSTNNNICLPALGNYLLSDEASKRTLLSPQKRHLESFKKDSKGYIDTTEPIDFHKKQLPGLLSFKERSNIIVLNKINASAVDSSNATKSTELSKISDSSINKITSSPTKGSNGLLNGNQLKSNKHVIDSILNDILKPPEVHLRKQSKDLDPIDEKYAPKFKGLQPLKNPVLHKIMSIPIKEDIKIEGKEMNYDVRVTEACENGRKSEASAVSDKKEAIIGEMFKTHEKWMEEAISKKDDSMVYTVKFEDCSSGSGSSHTLIDKSKIDFALVAPKKAKEEDESVHESIVDDEDDKSCSFCSRIVDSSALDDKKISGDNIFTCLAVIE